MSNKKIYFLIAVIFFLNMTTSLFFGTERLAEKGLDYFVDQTNHLSMYRDSVLYLSIIKNKSTFLDVDLPEFVGNKMIKVSPNQEIQRTLIDKRLSDYLEHGNEFVYPIIGINNDFLLYAETEIYVMQINKRSDYPIGYNHNYIWLFWDWIEIGSEIKRY